MAGSPLLREEMGLAGAGWAPSTFLSQEAASTTGITKAPPIWP